MKLRSVNHEIRDYRRRARSRGRAAAAKKKHQKGKSIRRDATRGGLKAMLKGVKVVKTYPSSRESASRRQKRNRPRPHPLLFERKEEERVSSVNPSPPHEPDPDSPSSPPFRTLLSISSSVASFSKRASARFTWPVERATRTRSLPVFTKTSSKLYEFS